MRGSRYCTTAVFGIYRARGRKEKTARTNACFESIFIGETDIRLRKVNWS